MLDDVVCDRDRGKLLNALCRMCSLQRTIPKSLHMENCLNEESTEDDEGCPNMFRGKHKGRAVGVKIVRLYLTGDFGKYFSVSILTPRIAEVLVDTGIPGILPRSCRMEASPASEHPTLAGCESRRASVGHDIRMDGSRQHQQVRRES